MKLKYLLIVVLLYLSAPLLATAQDGPPALSRESIYNLKSSWTTQDGKTVNISSLRGQPVVTALIYTNCKFMCPLAVEDMQSIDKEISKNYPQASVRFVLFSMDPEKDTPARLKEFAEAHNIDLKRWTLLRGGKKSVRSLAAVLGVRYRRNPQGDFEHSGIISLLDREGVIVYQKIGLQEDQGELINKVKQLTGGPK